MRLNTKITDSAFLFISRIMIYFIIMLIGIMLRTYVTHTVVIVWIINLLGLFLFVPYLRYVGPNLAVATLFYIIFGVITLSIITPAIKVFLIA